MDSTIQINKKDYDIQLLDILLIENKLIDKLSENAKNDIFNIIKINYYINLNKMELYQSLYLYITTIDNNNDIMGYLSNKINRRCKYFMYLYENKILTNSEVMFIKYIHIIYDYIETNTIIFSDYNYNKKKSTIELLNSTINNTTKDYIKYTKLYNLFISSK